MRFAFGFTSVNLQAWSGQEPTNVAEDEAAHTEAMAEKPFWECY